MIQTHTVDNIVDIQFLHGYNQPTLLILYEPLKTYAGRIAVRKDTCRLDVVTLDVKERLAAFIWSRYFNKYFLKLLTLFWCQLKHYITFSEKFFPLIVFELYLYQSLLEELSSLQ